MKKIVSFLFSVILVFAIVSNVAAASLEFSFDKKTLTLDIGGTLGSTEHQGVMVYIFDASLSESDLSDSNPPIFADVVFTEKGGLFNYSKKLSNTYPGGKYKVVVASADDSDSAYFMYANEATVTGLLSLINGAHSQSAMETVISSSADDLGIDKAIYNPIKTNVASFVYGNRPSGGFLTADDFINTLDQCMAAALIKNGENVEEVLKSYAKAISIDFEGDYNKFDVAVKSAINAEIANSTEYASKLMSELYRELRVVAFMKSAPTWQALKNAFYGVDASGMQIVSNYNIINPDLSVFNKVVNKDNVFANMFKQRALLTSVASIKNIFYECALNVYNLEKGGNNVSSGSSSGGSSGGGAVSGPITIEPGYQNQQTETLKPSLFKDTDTGMWYYHSLERLATLSLISGYEDKSFRPDNSITRAEFTKLVVGVAQYSNLIKEATSDAAFSDVSVNDWFYDVVKKATSNGLVNGADGKFNPNEQITRQDAAVILYRLISEVKTLDSKVEFNDKDMVADYAKDAVSLLAGANIISGMGNGTFAPINNLTRAQAAKLLYGVLEYLS